jgi:hypothetical protein
VPLSLAARLSLAAARAAGSLRTEHPIRRPRLVACSFDKHPVVGETAVLRWKTNKRTGAVWLRVEQEGAMLCDTPVPVNGWTRIPAPAAAPLQVSLALQPRRIRDDSEPIIYLLPPVMPTIPKPRFARLEVPQTVELHRTFDVVWDFPDASGVDLMIDDGQSVLEETRHASGVRTVTATRAGKWVVRLTAQGLHGTAVETRVVTVTVPAPQIYVDRKLMVGSPEKRITFSWHMTGVVRAYLHAPSREQRSDAALEGCFVAEIGYEPEVFFLTGIGIDGRRATVELRTEPYSLLNLSGPGN